MPIENRNLTKGIKLTGRYHKQSYSCEVVETAEGKLRYKLEDGREFKSPSAAGMAITGHFAMDGSSGACKITNVSNFHGQARLNVMIMLPFRPQFYNFFIIRMLRFSISVTNRQGVCMLRINKPSAYLLLITVLIMAMYCFVMWATFTELYSQHQQIPTIFLIFHRWMAVN